MTERHSVQVLRECIDLQNKKANDYQNANSKIKQADYYPSGCLTILEIIHAKVLRMRSVMEAMQNDPNYKPNFESLEDSAKDLVNYASFFVAYSRGKVDGQEADRDFLNRKKKVNPLPWGDINDIWNDDGLPPPHPTTKAPVDELDHQALVNATIAQIDRVKKNTSGFFGEVGDSGRDERFTGHPGVTADLKDNYPEYKGRGDGRWVIGAKGAD